MQCTVALKSNHGLSISLLFGWDNEIYMYLRTFVPLYLLPFSDSDWFSISFPFALIAEMRKWKWILGKIGVRILSNTVKTSQKYKCSPGHSLRLRDSDCKSLTLNDLICVSQFVGNGHETTKSFSMSFSLSPFCSCHVSPFLWSIVRKDTYMSMTLKSKVTQSIKSVSYWQGHWLSCPGPSLWKDSVSTDYNLTRSYVSQKVVSSSINPSQNPGFIQAAKEFFEKFKDCANVILGKESTANKQWTREKCFYTERKSFILLYFYSKNH